MATLASIATGNFTTSSTWGAVDSTSFLDSESNTTAISTSNLDSATFIPGAITVSHVAVKSSARASSPSGTFTVTLRNSTDSVDVASVTVNVSDLPASGLGWQMFKLSSPQTLTAGKSYLVRVVCSSTGSQVTLYRNSTSNNWSRALVTTTTQAPAAADQLIVAGEYTGAGTGNNFTVTMDSTASTVYGATSQTQSLTVNAKGKLTWGTADSTTYILKVAGLIDIMSGGTLEMGSVATPMPATSVGRLDFSVSSNVDSGIRVRSGGTWIGQGASKTVSALLAADASASATSLTSSSSTGWKNGDLIALSPTTRTYSEAESKSLTADASGTTLTITAITNARSGTSPTQADLINLTRNILIQGSSDSLQAYIVWEAGATIDWDYVEVYRMGSNTTLKRGIDCQVTTGTVNLNGCSMHDFIVTGSTGLFVTAATGTALTVTSMVSYNIERQHYYQSQTSSGSWSVDGWVAIKSVSVNVAGFDLLDCGGTFKNITAAGLNGPGISFSERFGVPVDWQNWNVHGCSNNAIQIGGVSGTVAGTNKSWRNNAGGIFASVGGGAGLGLELQNFDIFGNVVTSANIDIRSCGVTVFKNCTIAGDSTSGFGVSYGLNLAGNSSGGAGLLFIGCTFGGGGGIHIGHTSCDILIQTGNFPQVRFENCTFSSSTRISGQSTIGNSPFSWVSVSSSSENTVYFGTGTLTRDATIYRTAAPSLRLTPLTSSFKMHSAPLDAGVIVAATSGQTRTISVYVRKSVSGDGAAYNGNQPRLILRRNDLVGVTADTVLATASGAAGSWELLQGTTPSASIDGAWEVVVDCDGTTGWVNVDDWSAS